MMEEQQASNTTLANNAQSPLSALLSNPALLQGLGAMLANANGGNTQTVAASQTAPASVGEASTAAPALSIEPQLLSRLPQMMSVLSAIQKPLPPTPTGDREAAREALLCALKPFLSPSRAEAIDALLRLLRLSRAMGQFR